MEIFLNQSEEMLRKYNRVAIGSRFVNTLSSKDDTVALAIEGPSLIEDLMQYIGMEIPVVVIAGNGQPDIIELARDYGIPPECIVVKDTAVKTLDGFVANNNPARGISVSTIIRICQRALENRLIPEVLIWEESKIESTPYCQQKSIESPKYQSAGSPKPQKEKSEEKVFSSEKTISEHKAHLIQEELSHLIDSKKVVAVFKTVPDALAGEVSKIINHGLKGIHVEVGPNPKSSNYYNKDFEQAVTSGCYAYCKDGRVKLSNLANSDVLIIEIDADEAGNEISQLVYDSASYIIHVPSNLENSKTALDNWITAGLKISAIIPSKSNYQEFKHVFGDKIMDAQTFLNKVWEG